MISRGKTDTPTGTRNGSCWRSRLRLDGRANPSSQ